MYEGKNIQKNRFGNEIISVKCEEGFKSVLSLTCGVDHALGCCCRSSKDVRGAAGSGCSARGGCAHRVD